MTTSLSHYSLLTGENCYPFGITEGIRASPRMLRIRVTYPRRITKDRKKNSIHQSHPEDSNLHPLRLF